MSVTIADVQQVAKLARLHFSPEEMERLTHDLNEILQYVEKLNELDTDAVEPLAQVIELVNVFREDLTRPSLSREEALKNAPEHTGEFFTVPKVIADKGNS